MGVLELVRRNGVRRKATTEQDLKRLFREAATRFAVAIAEALGEFSFGDGGCVQGNIAFERFWLGHLRSRAREYLMLAVQDDEVRVRMAEVFRQSPVRGSGEFCVIPPVQVLLLLMRDERAVQGRQPYFDALDRHAEGCHSACFRCTSLAAGFAAMKQGFREWFDSPSRFPGSARALRQAENRGHSTAELVTYLYDKRRLDCVADLAFTPGFPESQSYKLVGWAKDAAHGERTGWFPVALAGDQAFDWRAADLGPAVSSAQLLDTVRRIGRDISACQAGFRHPGDRLLVNLVWEVLRQLHTRADLPEPEAVSISDVVRALVQVFSLPDVLDEVEAALENPAGRWRWKAIRWTVVASCTWPSPAVRLARKGGKPRLRDEELLQAVQAAVSSRRSSAALPLLNWIADGDKRRGLERKGKSSRRFGLAAKQLRDMYEEALKRVAAGVTERAGYSLTDPETLAALFDVAAGEEFALTPAGKTKVEFVPSIGSECETETEQDIVKLTEGVCSPRI